MTPDSTQKKHELLDAAQAAVASRPNAEMRVRGEGVPGATRWGLVLFCVATVVVTTGAVVAFRPSWVFKTAVASESPEFTEASLRVAMVRERQRISAFLGKERRLPASVTEAGGTLTGLELVPGPVNTYMLRYSSGGRVLELRSTDSLEAFLGNSLQIILARSKQ